MRRTNLLLAGIAALVLLAVPVETQALTANSTTPLETVANATNTDVGHLPVGVMTGCATTDLSLSCDDEMWRFIAEAGICLISAIGLLKATKTVKSAAKAARNGGNWRAIIWGAVGGFFCSEMWNSFWEWQDCSLETMDMNALDGDLDPFVRWGASQEIADALDMLADELLRGGIPVIERLPS